jgi:DNA-binding NtrC family response regulator
MTRVLLHSEDAALHSLLGSALGSEFQVFSSLLQAATRPPQAVEDFDVAMVDLNSHGDRLEECIQRARRMVGSQPPCVILADDPLRSTAVELVRLGAFGYCRRPPSIRDLRILLRRAHEECSLKKRLNAAQKQLETVTGCDRMIGPSLQMQQVYHLVNSVANLNVSVLVTGQSGTGKELVARAIHNRGARSNRPFVAVACGAIPETLIEAELFGHEKGAYTGTAGARAGYFEQAGDGTIFLDEIGELSLFTQVKLLRVLQEREFCRLGSNRVIPLRARLVFATNQNLAEMVDQGKFRQDLFYRINVVRIETPALRDHAEDIPHIAMHFVRQYSEMFQKPVQSIDPEALSLLMSCPWPGNVRELENVIQRAIVLAEGDSIRAADLPLSIQQADGIDPEVSLPSGSFERQIHEFKIRLANEAIRENNGNKTMAARSLSISRAYLHRLIRSDDPVAAFEQDNRELMVN